jgi:hypothetical protein
MAPLWPVLLAPWGHHGEAADPDLLEWIRGVLDHVLGVGPWAGAALMGLLILAIPAGTVVLYLIQQRRGNPDREGTGG